MLSCVGCQTKMMSSLYSVEKKNKWRHKLVATSLSNFNRFSIFTGRFLDKFAVKSLLKISQHFAYVATLPCKTLISAKQAINDKLLGSVAIYFRCSKVVHNQIKKGLLPMKKKLLKLVNIWQSYKQERDCLVHFLRLLAVCWPGAQSSWDNVVRPASVKFITLNVHLCRTKLHVAIVGVLWQFLIV